LAMKVATMYRVCTFSVPVERPFYLFHSRSYLSDVGPAIPWYSYMMHDVVIGRHQRPTTADSGQQQYIWPENLGGRQVQTRLYLPVVGSTCDLLISAHVQIRFLAT